MVVNIFHEVPNYDEVNVRNLVYMVIVLCWKAAKHFVVTHNCNWWEIHLGSNLHEQFLFTKNPTTFDPFDMSGFLILFDEFYRISHTWIKVHLNFYTNTFIAHLQRTEQRYTQHKWNGETSFKGRGPHLLVSSQHCMLLMRAKRHFGDKRLKETDLQIFHLYLSKLTWNDHSGKWFGKVRRINPVAAVEIIISKSSMTIL